MIKERRNLGVHMCSFASAAAMLHMNKHPVRRMDARFSGHSLKSSQSDLVSRDTIWNSTYMPCMF